jgi:hypothetical protein
VLFKYKYGICMILFCINCIFCMIATTSGPPAPAIFSERDA